MATRFAARSGTRDEAAAHGARKRAVAERHPQDRIADIEGKDVSVQALDARALAGSVSRGLAWDAMELEDVGATLRSFVSKSGALQAVAATPLGIITCDGTGAVFFQETDEDEPRQIEVKGVAPAVLDMELKRLPPFVVDEPRGEVHGPLGGLEHVAEGVLSLTRALGAPSVAMTWPPTTDDETQFVVSGRDGEGVVVVIGDESFTMDEGWPPKRPAS